MKKIKFFLALSWSIKLLIVESYFYLAWARILKRRPISKITSLLGEQMVETNYTINQETKQTLSDISQVIDLISKYTFWESKCLVQAIAGMKMLEKRQIESTLYLGTAKEESGEFVAHAWLRSGPFYITGAGEIDKFTIVRTFAKSI